MNKAQARLDEFAFILLAGISLIILLMIVWTTPPENPPVVEPTSKSLTMLNGTTTTFTINITGPRITNVTLSVTGEISNWISFSENNFDVPQSKLVTVYVNVPTNTIPRTYTGKIIIESTGGREEVSVTIRVVTTPVEVLSTRQILLGDFSVSYAVGSKTLDSQENVRVIGGHFSSKTVNLIGILTDEEFSILKDGYIRLIIVDTNELGNLIVEVNGVKVYDQVGSPGEILIPLNSSMIYKSNIIKIKAAPPTWVFWKSTTYDFRSVEFVVNFKGISSKEIEFSLSPEEVDGFDHFTLSALLTYTPPLPELQIRINDQIVYFQKPPLAVMRADFKRDILENPLILHAGNNSISFSLLTSGLLEFSNTILTVHYLP